MGNRAAWYMGTADGLFLLERKPGTERLSSRRLGLQHTGGFRARIVVDCEEPRRVFVGTTRAGILRSDDAGLTWQECNNGLLYKDIWSLTQHPRTGVLYAGTSPAGVFRSADRGATWTACEALWQLPSTREWHGPVPPHTSRLKDLAVSADDPTIIVGAIEEGWLVRSEDDGRTWQQIQEGVPHDSHSVCFVPGTSSNLALSGGDGMRTSGDGGITWTDANSGLDGRRYTPAPLVTRASRPGVVFSSVAAVGPGGWRRPQGGDTAFCRSDDAGQTWTTLLGGLPQPLAPIPRAIAIDPVNEHGFLAGLTDGSVWATADDGGSFYEVFRGESAVMSMAVVPAGSMEEQ